MGAFIVRDAVVVVFGATVATWCVDCVLLLLGFP
jgi:hypothetical protein